MPNPAFELRRHTNIPSLKLVLEEYQHCATGARHLHLAADDNNNVFMVSFLTVPMDSTGVAHILEHTSLCGSERYPVRDPFFMMMRRSLNTFMNALTNSDWTAYPFASQNRKDFDNLMRVYLDAVFFPKLEDLDFAQEGHRLEFEKIDDPNSALHYKGVVYNEMKGAMSSPVRKLLRDLYHLVYPHTTYHYNSGGDPEAIPTLTWQQLREFHASHYHPSNAIFMTYGDIPAEHHQDLIQECALIRFPNAGQRLSIKDEQRYHAPVYGDSVYAPPDNNGDIENKTHIVLSWLLGRSTNAREVMNALLLNGILLDNSAAPLLHALETTALGSAPGPLCGLDPSNREMLFYCGLEGSNPDQADAVESLILGVLEEVATHGIASEHLEAVLHQMELNQREISGDHYPYGLSLLLNMLSPVLHGADAVDFLDIDCALETLRQDIKNPEFIKGLVRQLLLDNPHRVRLVMKPDPELSERQQQAEKAQLAKVHKNLSENDIRAIITRTQALQARQNQENSPEILPKVGLEDVRDDLYVAQGECSHSATMPVTHYSQGTNGMVYQHLVIHLPELEEDLIDIIPWFCDAFTEVGVGKRDYRAQQAYQSAVSGGISARVQVRGGVDDVHHSSSIFTLSGKALARNHNALTELLADTFFKVRFDELPRLRDLIAQLRGDLESSINSRGNALAMNTACSTLNTCGAVAYRWSGLHAIQTIKRLDHALKDPQALTDLSQRFQRLLQKLLNAPRQCLLISEAELRSDVEASFARTWAHMPSAHTCAPFALIPPQTQITQAWSISAQVNFCVKVYPTVPYCHPDAPALQVLGEFLSNGYLHRALREQGGAYGGGASYHQDTGSFRFYSMRDPHVSTTFAHFDHALTWLSQQKHDPRPLEEAILSIIAHIDRPASPAGEAKIAFFGALHGRTPELRRAFRRGILAVRLEDLQRVAHTWLKPEHAHKVVLGNHKTLENEAPPLGLSMFSFN
jgi:presequence protease